MTSPTRSTRRQVVRGAVAGSLAALACRAPRPTRAALRQAPEAVRAVYMNPLAVSDDEFFGLMNLIETTELNAMVVDVKEDGVYLPTKVGLFLDADEVEPSVLDVDGLLRTLVDHGIYSIARVVTFRDSYLADSRPDLAVRDTTTGDPWRSYDGQGWLSPFEMETWDAYAAFALELAERGFDEIQFDYVRFPSDGEMATLDYGIPVDETLRADTIAAFLGSCRAALAGTGVVTSADVFGYTLLIDDIGIGQNLTKLAGAVDILSPMVYPSHYPEGSLALPGHPNDFPGETIALSLEAGAERVALPRLRPWLQDFSLSGMTPYYEAEVRAQIDACETAGTNGWMLWAADSVYTSGALRPTG